LTGRGPGTRDIADVDAVIARCFGTDDARIVHDPVQGGDVPREFLECALAAAVLVARADGELSDDELLLIEHVFASEISDWQTYLDPRVATARFLETATVLARSALEVGPTLLNLLFEVMLSDREVHPAEVAVLLEGRRGAGRAGALRPGAHRDVPQQGRRHRRDDDQRAGGAAAPPVGPTSTRRSRPTSWAWSGVGPARSPCAGCCACSAPTAAARTWSASSIAPSGTIGSRSCRRSPPRASMSVWP
jgi:hypothetical protein